MIRKTLPGLSTPEIPARESVLITTLLILLWIIQLRYPPLSYPHVGLLQLMVLALLTVMLPVRMYRAGQGGAASPMHPAFVPGCLFVMWVLIRWVADGFNFTGASDVGNILWGASYLLVGWCLTRMTTNRLPGEASSSHGTPGGRGDAEMLATIMIAAIAAMGLACGVHAAWQYQVGYEMTLQDLLRQIGDRAPDRTEMGLLHHLRLRRVASIWGDPNSLATFSAVAICAALELLSGERDRFRRVLQALGAVTIPMALLAIYYSGSRGGVLDALLALLGFGGWILFTRTGGRSRNAGAGTSAMAVLVVAAVFFVMMAPQTRSRNTDGAIESTSVPIGEVTAGSAVGPKEGVSGWTWRSSTVTERLYYLGVGVKMIKMAPIAGLGPGSVERYFGRLKPPEARESRYLHNWVVQVWAENGIIGLGLLLVFLIMVAVAAIKSGVWMRPVDRALLFIFGLFLFDGLIQISWNQRELLSTFGLITGILMARSMVAVEAPQSRYAIPPTLRLALCLALAATFALAETLFLAGKNSKYIALDAMHAGEPQRARDFWNKASQWTPLDSEPYAARASMAAAAGQLTVARQLLDKAIMVNPTSAGLFSQRADVLLLLRQEDEAYKSLTNALTLYPSHPQYNYQMAQLLKSRGMPNEAIKYARSAVKHNYMDTTKEQYEALLSELEDITPTSASYD